jgi:hypothetical protein
MLMTTDLISNHVIDQAMFLTDQPISCHDFDQPISGHHLISGNVFSIDRPTDRSASSLARYLTNPSLAIFLFDGLISCHVLNQPTHLGPCFGPTNLILWPCFQLTNLGQCTGHVFDRPISSHAFD